MHLWDVIDKADRPSLEKKCLLQGHGDNVSAATFSPSGSLLATARWEGTVHLWDVAAGRERRVLQGHKDELCSLAFSPDGTRLASGSRDHTILIWDVPEK